MEVFIWGTGTMALKFYYYNKNKYDIKGFIDNALSKKGTMIDGKPVIHPEEDELPQNSYILIASTWWKDIALQLKHMDRKPFADYMPVCLLNPLVIYNDIYELSSTVGGVDYTFLTNKKIAVVYGNCQTGCLEKLFALYKEFIKEYLIVQVPKVCHYAVSKAVTDHLMSDVPFWKNVDLFIYQTVKRDNRFSEKVATAGILDILKKDALKVNIVNVYFTGYFPQVTVKKDRILSEFYPSGVFPFGDKYIDNMLSLGMSADSIKLEVQRADFVTEDEVEKAVRDSINELCEREKCADVKITDYIIKNYRSEQLFYSNNHPNEKLILEYAGRIMQFLGYERQEISLTDAYIICKTLKGQDIPLYPSVIKALGLKKYEKKFYPNRYIYEGLPLDFEEFIDLYIANYKGR